MYVLISLASRLHMMSSINDPTVNILQLVQQDHNDYYCSMITVRYIDQYHHVLSTGQPL
jgi:hypothetical protein